MDYSFWSIPSNNIDLVHLFIKELGYTATKEEALSFKEINCSKLWHRKYFFSGPTPAVLINNNEHLFLLEEIPSTLYYADTINARFSKEHSTRVTLFFHYPSAKSTGLKIFKDGNLTRHLQSEIDYEVFQNHGTQLSFESEVEKDLNKFKEKDLTQYLEKMGIPIPPTQGDSPVKLLSLKR